MGVAFATGACLCCHQMFFFNPMRVPSFRVNGNREPICLSCMHKINAKRKEANVDPFPIYEDAYEPCDETEL